MKLGPVTKLDKRNTAASKKKKIDDDFMLTNGDVIVLSDFWPICSHPEGGFQALGLKNLTVH